MWLTELQFLSSQTLPSQYTSWSVPRRSWMRCWRMPCIGVDGSSHIPRDMLCLDLEALLTRQRAVLPLMRFKNKMRRRSGARGGGAMYLCRCWLPPSSEPDSEPPCWCSSLLTTLFICCRIAIPFRVQVVVQSNAVGARQISQVLRDQERLDRWCKKLLSLTRNSALLLPIAKRPHPRSRGLLIPACSFLLPE